MYVKQQDVDEEKIIFQQFTKVPLQSSQIIFYEVFTVKLLTIKSNSLIPVVVLFVNVVTTRTIKLFWKWPTTLNYIHNVMLLLQIHTYTFSKAYHFHVTIQQKIFPLLVVTKLNT